ncbi:MAG: hypothetical protein IH946_08575 [Bacteroidetes bacterium]|nr:hypothetical protein [Bacteroidota bacterium]
MPRQFFRFKTVGNINWVLIPFLIAFAWNIRRKANWQIALFGIYILGIALIAVKGYYNGRYQLTFFPFTVAFVLISVWDWLDRRELGYLKRYLIAGLVVALIGNNVVFMISGKLKEMSANRLESDIGSQKGSLIDFLSTKVTDYGTRKLERISERWTELVNYDYLDHKPNYLIINYIDSVGIKEKVLNNNLPYLYYYTDIVGVFYWSGRDVISTKDGRYSLLKDRSYAEIRSYLLEELECKYIISSLRYNEFNDRFKYFVENYCVEEYVDNHEYVIYRIK